MDAYLVGAAGFQLAFDQGHEAEAFEYAIVGYCVFALVGIVGYPEAEAVVRVAGDVLVDGAFVFFYISPDYGLIAPSVVWLKNCFARRSCASSFLATSSSPLVSLSIR